MKPTDYDRVEKTLHYLSQRFSENPPLEKLAREAGLSPFYFQRLFKRWAGVSPKQFIQYLSAQKAKQRLLQSKSLLDAAFDAGLSSPGRLHDLLLSVEAMTPGDYRRRGRDLVLEYGTCGSPFGLALLVFTPRGLSGLAFLKGKGFGPELKDFKRRWPLSTFRWNEKRAAQTGRRLFQRVRGKGDKLRLVLKGTAFQLRVWEALLKVPEGALVSYGRLAREVGRAGASRAVGSAVGQNPIAYLIPCHRVIRESGVLGEYHWGAERKKALLGWEAAQK